MRLFKFYILVFTFFISSCIVRKIGGNEFILKPQKERNQNLKLNLDGAYVCSVKVENNLSSYIVWFLYANGVTQSYFCNIRKPEIQVNDLTIANSINQEILNDPKLNKMKTGGGYKINENDFKFQEFQIGHYGIYDLWTYRGKVFNDSIIIISLIKKEKETSINKSLFFKLVRMSKPDSTNQWMNKKWYWAD